MWGAKEEVEELSQERGKQKNTEQEVRRIRDKKELGGEEVEDIEEEGKGKNKRSRRKKGRLQQ
jgi:hypothetical protein